MSIHVVGFPFDLFGNAGCSAGAKLLYDVVQEILDDTEQESRPIRTHVLTNQVTREEISFDSIEAVTEWQSIGATAIRQSLKQADFTLWLGGNHLSLLPVYEAWTANDLIIQLDAHLDCFDLHDTTETLSHGNFLRHAKVKCPVINLGHRDLIQTAESIAPSFARAIPASEIGTTLPNSLSPFLKKAKRIWIDIDVDVFDPAFCPAVHQRTPFGLSPQSVLSLLSALMKTNRVVGVSLSEFDPGRDVNDISLAMLGWLVEWLLVTTAVQ